MEGKKQNASLGMIAGVLLAVVAVVRLLDVLSILFGWGFFYFEGLLYVAALAFFAVMLLMKRQDHLLLIAVGVHALMVLMIDNPLLVIAALLLAAVVLTGTLSHKLGGLTGDCLGAVNETAEVLFLVAVAAMG